MQRLTLATGTPAHLSLPADGRHPTRGLVLWPDIFGLRPLFDGHAQRLADRHGWAVCAVELYPGEETMPLDQRHARAAGFADADKLADAAAAADVLARVCGEDAAVGLLGFCMGGMYVMKSLATGRFDRAVAFYGMVRVPEAWRGGGQGDALDVVRSRPSGELLCIFGTDDPWCPENDMDDVEAAGAHVVRYPGAGHGWAQDPDRDNYLPEQAADAWGRAERFLVEGLAD